MWKISILFCFLFYISVINAVDLPSYFTKCKKSDTKLNDCILKNIIDNWPTFIEGSKTYHVQKMNPLTVDFMQVKVDANLYGNLTQGSMTGFEVAQFRDLNLDLDKNVLDIHVFFPISTVTGRYDIVGKLLGLSIADTGTVNVTFVGGLNKYHIEYKITDKKGKQHIEITNSVVDNEKVERIYFDSELERNKELGGHVKKVLNENWQEVTKEVQGSVGVALGGIVKAILQPFFNKVPYDDFFAKE